MIFGLVPSFDPFAEREYAHSAFFKSFSERSAFNAHSRAAGTVSPCIMADHALFVNQF
jgi:hypothetical protein